MSKPRFPHQAVEDPGVSVHANVTGGVENHAKVFHVNHQGMGRDVLEVEAVVVVRQRQNVGGRDVSDSHDAILVLGDVEPTVRGAHLYLTDAHPHPSVTGSGQQVDVEVSFAALQQRGR